MAEYIEPQLETDGDALAQQAYDYLQTAFPGWSPNEGNLETILIESLAPLAAENRDVAHDITTSIFKYWGAKVLQLPAGDSAPATVTSTWTARDDFGYTVEAGLQITLENSDGDQIAFEVLDDVVIPNGSTATGAGAVTLVAVEEGLAGNGLTGPVTLLDSTDWVLSVTLTTATGGGLDEETEEAYTARLVDQLKLLTPTPITVEDYERVARNFPSVYRALGLDLYDADTSTSGVERHITVVVADIDGQPVVTPVKTALLAYLQSLRETNFVVHIIDAQYTDIDVTFTATAYEQYDPADVEARAVAAVSAYLSPASWGLPNFGSEAIWIDEPEVRFWEIITVLNNVEGLNTVDTCVIGITGGPPAADTDLTLTGPAGLPDVGTITGTVS